MGKDHYLTCLNSWKVDRGGVHDGIAHHEQSTVEKSIYLILSGKQREKEKSAYS